MIKEILGKYPQIDPSAWVAENAVITGDVIIGIDSTVFFYSVIRGDVNQIRVGDRTNIQDGSIVHGSTGKQDTIIGNDVTIGHKAIIHGCVIEDLALIGMGATILDDVTVESNAIVAAGSVVAPRKVIKSGYLYGGVPAQIIRELNAGEVQEMIKQTADSYVKVGREYKSANL